MGSTAWEARVGIALLGVSNRPVEALRDACPFDDDFNDNFARGTGQTEEASLEALRARMESLAESLWAE